MITKTIEAKRQIIHRLKLIREINRRLERLPYGPEYQALEGLKVDKQAEIIDLEAIAGK